ncbi:MAG: UDP-N-acetylmuramoyl-tripeptide--D-alanyl-D-alanine ligase [Halieaceae bacterium]|jgi:UDP-N-acetylmuramoyl-tripeptide--D-alanyl-D-alanine ligase|nr:UDP-N-acetylmuramoyl-tripeptide--D-alanyl-D-alanine ligase [Halieaceae bacterium]
MASVALQALAQRANGELIGESVPLQGLAIDSRSTQPGDLFAAIEGSQVDGHDFAPQATAAGAAAVLTEREVKGITPQLVVSDVVKASGHFALLKRQAFLGSVVAVTGSAGKTTTKNLIAAALAGAGAVHATQGNHNNELGVPMTLAGLNESHRFGVIEMGAGQPGDIAYLCQLAQPSVAVCLNASAAHLVNYESVDEIASTKGEILEGLGGEGLAIINADQPWVGQWIKQAGNARKITFGLSEKADYRAINIQYQGLNGTQFDLIAPSMALPVSLRLPGAMQVINALAALAVAIELGVPPDRAVDGLRQVVPEIGRGSVVAGRAGGRVVDDSYNANPAAVMAAIDTLARESAYSVLILGPMLELGSTSDDLHRDVGRYAKAAGIDCLMSVGREAAPAAEVFGQGAQHFSDQQALWSAFPDLPDEHIIWVKGSRGAVLEKTVHWLTRPEEGSSC